MESICTRKNQLKGKMESIRTRKNQLKGKMAMSEVTCAVMRRAEVRKATTEMKTKKRRFQLRGRSR